jgi:Ca2+-binding RTX toxin-like protein
MADLKNASMSGGVGNDTITYVNFINSTIFANAGNDIVTLTSVSMDGGLIDLGDGNDTLSINQFTTTSSPQSVVIDGGQGTDTLRLRQYKAQDLQWSWADQVGWQLRNKDGTSNFAVVNNVENVMYAGGVKARFATEAIESSGSTFNVGKIFVTGTAVADTITAFAGSQTDVTVRAGKGNDTINFFSSFSSAGYRLSLLDGGVGKDTLVLSGDTNDYKFEFVSGSYYLQALIGNNWTYLAKLTAIEKVTFSDGVTGTLGSRGVSLLATDASVSLFGTRGSDTLTGGKGDDTITPFAGNDVIDLRAGGSDLVSISNNLYLAPLTAVTIYGRQRDDALELDRNYTLISDSRSYTSSAPTGIQVGDLVLGWDNGAKTVFHFKE